MCLLGFRWAYVDFMDFGTFGLRRCGNLWKPVAVLRPSSAGFHGFSDVPVGTCGSLKAPAAPPIDSKLQSCRSGGLDTWSSQDG